jgi:hypothetical protein
VRHAAINSSPFSEAFGTLSQVAHQRHKPEDKPIAPNRGQCSNSQRKDEISRKVKMDPQSHAGGENEAKHESQEDRQSAHDYLTSGRLVGAFL